MSGTGAVAVTTPAEKAAGALLAACGVAGKEFLSQKPSSILGIRVCVKKFASVEGNLSESRAESHLCWEYFPCTAAPECLSCAGFSASSQTAVGRTERRGVRAPHVADGGYARSPSFTSFRSLAPGC